MNALGKLTALAALPLMMSVAHAKDNGSIFYDATSSGGGGTSGPHALDPNQDASIRSPNKFCVDFADPNQDDCWYQPTGDDGSTITVGGSSSLTIDGDLTCNDNVYLASPNKVCFDSADAGGADDCISQPTADDGLTIDIGGSAALTVAGNLVVNEDVKVPTGKQFCVDSDDPNGADDCWVSAAGGGSQMLVEAGEEFDVRGSIRLEEGEQIRFRDGFDAPALEYNFGKVGVPNGMIIQDDIVLEENQSWTMGTAGSTATTLYLIPLSAVTLTMGTRMRRTFAMVNRGYHGKLAGQSVSLYPRFAVYSDADPALTSPKWGERWYIYHDGSNARMGVSKGALRLSTDDLTSFQGQAIDISTASTELTSMSGATATASSLIPAGCVVQGLTARVTTLVTGATTFSIGDGSDVDAFGNGIAVAADTTSDNSDWTLAYVPIYPSATDVVLTGSVNFTAGAVRLTVHCVTAVAPGS